MNTSDCRTASASPLACSCDYLVACDLLAKLWWMPEEPRSFEDCTSGLREPLLPFFLSKSVRFLEIRED